MGYGYFLKDQYGTLGPLTDDRLLREVYTRTFMPSDPEGVVAGVVVSFTVNIPQMDITKGVIITHSPGIVGFNNVFMYPMYKYTNTNSYEWRSWLGGNIWNNNTKTLTFNLNTTNPTIGNYVAAYMYK